MTDLTAVEATASLGRMRVVGIEGGAMLGREESGRVGVREGEPRLIARGREGGPQIKGGVKIGGRGQIGPADPLIERVLELRPKSFLRGGFVLTVKSVDEAKLLTGQKIVAPRDGQGRLQPRGLTHHQALAQLLAPLQRFKQPLFVLLSAFGGVAFTTGR